MRPPGFSPGAPLEVVFRDGRIEIAPVPVEVTISTVDGVAVAAPCDPVPVLSAGTVGVTRDGLRGGRG